MWNLGLFRSRRIRTEGKERPKNSLIPGQGWQEMEPGLLPTHPVTSPELQHPRVKVLVCLGAGAGMEGQVVTV